MVDLIKQKEHLVTYSVPEHHLCNYYKTISDNGPLYSILSLKGDESNLFFAPYKGSKKEFVTYVFFRLDDAKKYMKAVKDSGYTGSDSLVAWESTAPVMVNSIKRIVDREKQGMTKNKYHVISSIYLHDAFRDIEYFWTDDENAIN